MLPWQHKLFNLHSFRPAWTMPGFLLLPFHALRRITSLFLPHMPNAAEKGCCGTSFPFLLPKGVTGPHARLQRKRTASASFVAVLPLLSTFFPFDPFHQLHTVLDSLSVQHLIIPPTHGLGGGIPVLRIPVFHSSFSSCPAASRKAPSLPRRTSRCSGHIPQETCDRSASAGPSFRLPMR